MYGRLLSVDPPFAGGIMHWTYPVPLRMEGWINVYTIHDVIPLLRPDLTPIAQRRHRRLLGRIVAAADRIATVSEASRDEIVAALGCPPGLVQNTGQSVDAPAGGEPAQLPRGLVPGGYLLVCGSVEPRKNVARILDAYRQSGVAMPLVLAGPDGWNAAEIIAQIAATPNALRLGWQTRETIDALIGNARALLMPSLAEGFGLPVIQAMARAVPVVTSGAGALAETAGGAALLVDPLDTAELAAAIRGVSMDDALCARLAAAGRRRAEAFTPDRIAPRLERLYAELVASRAAPAYRPTLHPAGDPN